MDSIDVKFATYNNNYTVRYTYRAVFPSRYIKAILSILISGYDVNAYIWWNDNTNQQLRFDGYYFERYYRHMSDFSVDEPKVLAMLENCFLLAARNRRYFNHSFRDCLFNNWGTLPISQFNSLNAYDLQLYLLEKGY